MAASRSPGKQTSWAEAQPLGQAEGMSLQEHHWVSDPSLPLPLSVSSLYHSSVSLSSPNIHTLNTGSYQT